MIVSQEPAAQSKRKGRARGTAHKKARSCAPASLFGKQEWGASIKEEKVCGENEAGGIIQEADKFGLDRRDGGRRLFHEIGQRFPFSFTLILARLIYHFVLATAHSVFVSMYWRESRGRG